MLILILSRPLWLWYFTIRKYYGFWLWSGCEEKTSHLISVLYTHTHTHTQKFLIYINQSSGVYRTHLHFILAWDLKSTQKVMSCIFNERSKLLQYFTQLPSFPQFLSTPCVFFKIFSFSTVGTPTLVFLDPPLCLQEEKSEIPLQ